MGERTQSKIKEFKSFTTEQKKQKLLAVFEYIKGSVDFAEGVIAYLQDSPEDFGMDVLYETVMEYAQYLNEEDDKKRQLEKDKIFQESKKAEEKDKEEANNILSGLMDLV